MTLRNNDKTEFYDKLQDAICKEAAKFSPPLVYDNNLLDSSNMPTVEGTSILLSIKSRFFLITAAHVYSKINPLFIGIMIGNFFYPITDSPRLFEPNNDFDNYDPNKLDIAICELNNETVNYISEFYSFLDYSKLAINHVNAKTRYIIFGYPEKRTKINNQEKKIAPKPFVFITLDANSFQYLNKNTDPEKTLIIQVYQKKVMRSATGLIERLSKLNGISGCGIWDLYNLDINNPDFKLTAILTGQNKEKTLIYSTKVNSIMKLLNQHFYLSF